MLKKILALVILLPALVFSQAETLVGNGFENGGYGGPLFRIGIVKGKVVAFTGGRGAWIINHRFAIGGGGYSMMSSVKTDGLSPGGDPLYLKMETGGFELEYINDSDKLLHWTVHLTLGGGAVRLIERSPDKEIYSDHMYLVEPSANLDMNITEWFRLGAQASYRLVMGLDLPVVTNGDVSGPTIGLILKFGSF